MHLMLLMPRSAPAGLTMPPPVGACGERNYGLFFGIFFEDESKVGIPTLLPTTHIRPIFFHHKHPVSQNIKFDVC